MTGGGLSAPGWGLVSGGTGRMTVLIPGAQQPRPPAPSPLPASGRLLGNAAIPHGRKVPGLPGGPGWGTWSGPPFPSPPPGRPAGGLGARPFTRKRLPSQPGVPGGQSGAQGLGATLSWGSGAGSPDPARISRGSASLGSWKAELPLLQEAPAGGPSCGHTRTTGTRAGTY